MTPSAQRLQRIRLLGLGILALAAWVAIGVVHEIKRFPVEFLAALTVAFAAYAVAARLVWTGHAPRSRAFLLVILVLAAGFRVAVLPCVASDDVNRYLWEGRVQRAGYNPFVLAPTAPEIQHLHRNDPYWHEIWKGQNHPDLPAIYPPVQSLWHRVFGWSFLSTKLSFLAAEAILIVLLLLHLRRRNLDPTRVLLYAWNPLPIVATALEGHHDVVYIALLWGALYLLESPRRRVWSALVWVTSILAKFFAAAAWPVFIRRVRWWMWGVAALLAGLWYLPYLDAGHGILGSLVGFATEGTYNSSLYILLQSAARGLGLYEAFPYGPRLVCLGLWLGVAAYVWRRLPNDPVRQAMWLFAAMLLILPVAHPWYFLAIVPFFVIRPWAGWVAMSYMCSWSYLAQLEIWHTGVWTEWYWVTALEYLPLYAWLALRAWTRFHAWRSETPRRSDPVVDPVPDSGGEKLE